MPKFNKRHYEAIAHVMQEAKTFPVMVHETGKPTVTQWDMTVSRLAALFASDNGLFKKERFIAACEPGANVRARTAHLKRNAAKVTPCDTK
jgi:hypothetical protein